MSNAIKVGDRVWASGLGDGRMLAIHDDYGWVLWNTHDHCTARLDSLTRIEPEPVTLRPRYGMGQRVRTDSLRLTVTPDNIYVVKSPAVGYELESGGWLPESLLFPVPTPCPTCKGSGKASE